LQSAVSIIINYDFKPAAHDACFPAGLLTF